MPVLVQFQHRFDTVAAWSAANPVLLAGELGLDTTAGRYKVGDGSTAWNSLGYQQTKVLTGSGAPAGGLGVDGDLYIRDPNTAPQLYGPKAAGAWGSGTTMVGPQGIQGVQGNPGNNGSNGVGVPTGGTTGQVLRKVNATDHNTVFGDTPVDGSTLEITGNNVARVKDGGITLAKMAGASANTLRGNNTGSPATLDLTPAQVTAMLDVASASLKGLLSSADKKIIDSLHYDAVADFGMVGNDSTDNLAAFNNALSVLPVGAQLYFPAGVYRVSGEVTINVDKRIRFFGSGRYNSIIKTTSASANIFNITVPAWYNTFEDLGFQSTVTKTAGAAIAITSGSAVGTNVYRCWMNGLFKAIDAQGSQSGNLSVWSDLDISAIPNGGRGIHINGAVINVMIHNVTMNAGAATTSACCEINQSGAVQVTACDWIQGTNVVLLNSTAGAGPQAVYFTNCFFDQPQGSVIKVIGTNTANRIKFTQCGIATGAAGQHGVEIAGTGAGGVGTATALPAGISIVDCDIYHQNPAGSAGSGIFINGAQDVNIANTRVTGYSLAGGCGIQVTPSAANQTKVRINGCIIGPNGNLTVTNETAIKLNAGASAMGGLSITDNTLLGNTTAINDASTVLATATKIIRDNQGAAAGLTGLAPSGQAITTAATDTAVAGMQVYLPPNSIKVGTTIRWTRVDTLSATSTTVERAHIGTAGTTADATNLAATSAASGAAATVFIEGQISFSTVGAAATFNGGVSFTQLAVAGGAPLTTITGTVNTTVGNYVTISTANGTANTRTVRSGAIEVLSPA